MKRKWLGLIEGIYAIVFVTIVLTCPLFYLSDKSVATFFAYVSATPVSKEALATYVFMFLFLVFGVTRIVLSFTLEEEKEAQATTILFYIWAMLGVVYMLFLDAPPLFIVVAVYTVSVIVFYYIDRHLYGKKKE